MLKIKCIVDQRMILDMAHRAFKANLAAASLPREIKTNFYELNLLVEEEIEELERLYPHLLEACEKKDKNHLTKEIIIAVRKECGCDKCKAD